MKKLLLILLLASCSASLLAQAPKISYSTPPVFTAGVAITPLQPSNTGGAVPANVYAQTSAISDSTGLYSSTGAKYPSANLRDLYGITLDAQANIYVGQSQPALIKKITPQAAVSAFGGNWPASTYAPGRMCADNAGNIYVADFINKVVKKISPAGIVSTIGDTVSHPGGIAVDKNGNIYVSEPGLTRIRKISATGQTTLFAGTTGVPGNNNGTLASAKFADPTALTIDNAGNLFVVDRYVVRKISVTGQVTTLAGKLYSWASTDGRDTSASFREPGGITVDAAGNVYVAEPYAIRKISPDGYVSTIAGKPNNGGIANGVGAAAGFWYLNDLVFDGIGNLYTVERQVVRKVSLIGYAIDKPLPSGLVFDAKTGIISGKPTGTFLAATYKITAYNLAGESSATVTLRCISSDPRLSNLTFSIGTLSPAYTSGNITYQSSVPVGTTSVMVTPQAFDSTATIKINGVVALNSRPNAVAISAGDNTVAVTVLASDGVATRTYSVKVNRPRSSEVYITNIALSDGYLTWDEWSAAYKATVDGPISGFRLKISTTTNTTIKINGVVSASGAFTNIIPLNYGINTFPVEVTSEDGTKKNAFTIIITRGSASTEVTNFFMTPGTLSKHFIQNTWIANVPAETGSIRLKANATNANIKLKVQGGVSIPQSEWSDEIPLHMGLNDIVVEVTAEDGIAKDTYYISIARGSSEIGAITVKADIATLTVDQDYYWTALLPNADRPIRILAKTANPNVTIKINDVVVSQNTYSEPITLQAGLNSILIEITAEDGRTKAYQSVDIGVGSPNTDFAAMELSGPQGMVALNRVGTTDTWTATVNSMTDKLVLHMVKSDPQMSIYVQFMYTEPYVDLPLNYGVNDVYVYIAAPNGLNTRYLHLIITRTPISTDAGLSSLALTSPTTTLVKTGNSPKTYTATVLNTTTSIKVTAKTRDAKAVIRVNGTMVAAGVASAAIPLNVGSNIITIRTTAEDGVSTEEATITVTRSLPAEAGFSSLALWYPTTTLVKTGNAPKTYSAEVANTTLSIKTVAKAKDPAATITINGLPVAGGEASNAIPLNVGPNTISVVITAQDGITTETATITVTREASHDASFASLALVSPTTTLTKTGNTPKTYTATVKNSTTSIKVTTKTKDATATIKVNGAAVSSGLASAAIPLSIGANTISVVITAQDGTTTESASIAVTRQAAGGIVVNATNQNQVALVQKPADVVPGEQREEIVVKKAVSPNGDGINDRFTIEGISAFPLNTVRVMNRNGEVVYEAKGYDNQSIAFDGRGSNGTQQQPGTYFYSIEYKKGTQTLKSTGYLVLKY